MGGTVAEVTLPADEFVLQETLAELTDVKFEVERLVAHDPEHVIPFVWVAGSDTDRDALERTLADDSSIDEFELLTEFDDEWLYRMDWIDHIQLLIHILVEEEGTILAAYGRDEAWMLRILFPDHGALSRTHEHSANAGLAWNVQRIYRLDEGRQGRFGLTEKQQSALAAAFEHGYYEIPREISAQELARELGTSHQALSEMLRRAHKSLVKNAIVIGRGAEAGPE